MTLKKRGNILTENLVGIILNLIFLAILVAFLYNQTAGVKFLEEAYAKNIALLIDSAKPGMEIYIDMRDAYSSAKDNKMDLNKIVNINGNTIVVKLKDDSNHPRAGYSYSFFNNVNVDVIQDLLNQAYVFQVREKP